MPIGPLGFFPPNAPDQPRRSTTGHATPRPPPSAACGLLGDELWNGHIHDEHHDHSCDAAKESQTEGQFDSGCRQRRRSPGTVDGYELMLGNLSCPVAEVDPFGSYNPKCEPGCKEQQYPWVAILRPKVVPDIRDTADQLSGTHDEPWNAQPQEHLPPKCSMLVPPTSRSDPGSGGGGAGP